ncbi:MAG: C39 family peptidase [Anaerolineaceae bacterium]
MTTTTAKPHRFIYLSIPLIILLTGGAIFAIRTQGFGYFVTPTLTITPTSTIMFIGANFDATQTATPFQPLPTDTPTPTATFTPTATLTPTATATNTPLPTNTPQPQPTAKPLPTNAPEDGLPSSYQISGVNGHGQSYNLSCEARAAADWAAFYGVSLSENSIQSALPITDNPETGFVGDVNGTWGQIPPNDYGVHANPIASILSSNGVSANASKGVSLTELRRQIASGNPVLVWVVGAVWGGSPVSYTASDGSTTTVAYYEHVVILTGYDETGFNIVDGYSSYWRSNSSFSSSFGALNNMAITH